MIWRMPGSRVWWVACTVGQDTRRRQNARGNLAEKQLCRRRLIHYATHKTTGSPGDSCGRLLLRYGGWARQSFQLAASQRGKRTARSGELSHGEDVSPELTRREQSCGHSSSTASDDFHGCGSGLECGSAKSSELWTVAAVLRARARNKLNVRLRDAAGADDAGDSGRSQRQFGFRPVGVRGSWGGAGTRRDRGRAQNCGRDSDHNGCESGGTAAFRGAQ